MKRSHFVAIVASAITLCAAAPVPQPTMPKFEPSPEMQSLIKALSGRWAIKGRFEPSEDMPSGGAVSGEEEWRAGPGGLTFMEEARDQMPFGTVYIVGYTWWDATKKAFGGMECNSTWPNGCDLQAALSRVAISWDGQRFTVDFKSSKDPNKIAWHEVFSDIASSSFTQTADALQADGTMKRAMAIHATRIGN